MMDQLWAASSKNMRQTFIINEPTEPPRTISSVEVPARLVQLWGRERVPEPELRVLARVHVLTRQAAGLRRAERLALEWQVVGYGAFEDHPGRIRYACSYAKRVEGGNLLAILDPETRHSQGSELSKSCHGGNSLTHRARYVCIFFYRSGDALAAIWTHWRRVSLLVSITSTSRICE
jgi:hypothetical protein